MKTADRPDRPVSDYHLLARLFFRLLPYQILLIVINAVNGIVDSLVASNVVGTEAMSAIGLYTPPDALPLCPQHHDGERLSAALRRLPRKAA